MLLAIDTSLSAVGLALMRDADSRPFAQSVVEMERGHAERLMPLLQDLLKDNHIFKKDIRKIAVTVGPGSYTGIRIGIAAAKTMGLALNAPVVGVSTLAALAAPLLEKIQERPIFAVINARNDNIYIQSFNVQTPKMPELKNRFEFIKQNQFKDVIFIGPEAKKMAFLAQDYGQNADYVDQTNICDITFIARLGWIATVETATPLPLYLNTPSYKKLVNS